MHVQNEVAVISNDALAIFWIAAKLNKARPTKLLASGITSTGAGTCQQVDVFRVISDANRVRMPLR